MILTSRMLVLFLLMATAAFAEKPKVIEEIRGTVSGVIDGDTIVLHTSAKPLTIRLEGIDAPESSQRYGTESRDALKKLLTGKEVTVLKTGIDQYQRVLGTVIVEKTDACAKMVEDGWAWHFKKYNSDENLAKLEAAAKEAKRGLWQEDRVMAPWDYRAARNDSGSSAGASHAPKSSKPKSTSPSAAPSYNTTVTPAPEPENNSGMVWVNGYTRKNGTVVKGYWRRK